MPGQLIRSDTDSRKAIMLNSRYRESGWFTFFRKWRHWNYRSTAVAKHKNMWRPCFTRRHVFAHHRRPDHLFGRKNCI